MIDEKKLIQDRPEFLNEQQDISMQNEKGGYNKGWNDCLKTFLDIIKDQQKVGEWIPVEERLPKHYGQYLITALNDCGGVYMAVSYYDSQYKSFSPDGVEDDIAIAWMDLPKMYEVKE